MGIAILPPKLTLFLSTPSARRATSGRVSPSGSLIFLSTPSARRATNASLQRLEC